jgi:hypothetical protein
MSPTITAAKVLDDALGHIRAGWIQGDMYEVESTHSWTGDEIRFTTDRVSTESLKVVGVCSLGGMVLAAKFENAPVTSRINDSSYKKAVRALYHAIYNKPAPTADELRLRNMEDDGVSEDDADYDPAWYTVSDEELYDFIETEIARFNDRESTTRRKVIHRFKKARQLISERKVR